MREPPSARAAVSMSRPAMRQSVGSSGSSWSGFDDGSPCWKPWATSRTGRAPLPVTRAQSSTAPQGLETVIGAVTFAGAPPAAFSATARTAQRPGSTGITYSFGSTLR